MPSTNVEVHGITVQRTDKAPANQYMSWASTKTMFTVPSGSDPHFITENIWKSKNKIDVLYEKLQTMAEVSCFSCNGSFFFTSA